MRSPRLATLERAALLEELASAIRHDLRNRLAAIKNASFYLKTKTRASLLWQSDKNVARFYQVIEDELAAAGELIARHLMQSDAFGLEVAPVALRACVEEAVALARLPEHVALECAFAETRTVQADRLELVLLARCLLDHAVERLPAGGRLSLRTSDREGDVVLELAGADPPAGEGDDLPMPLKIARRITVRYGGTFAPALITFPAATPTPP